MFAVDVCEGSGELLNYTNGTMIFKFKDCCKKINFDTLIEIMFKLNKYPKKMTYDEYTVYATMVEL